MPVPSWEQSAGAVMVGPDGRVYLVPAADQAAFPIAGRMGQTSRPQLGDSPAGTRARKGVQDAMDRLPQMPLVMC